MELLEMPLWGLFEEAKPTRSYAFWRMTRGVEKPWKQADIPVLLDE